MLKVGFEHVGAVCAMTPLATLMLLQDKLLKFKVPFTTQTLLPAGSTLTETVNGLPTVPLCDEGETYNAGLSA